jgi:LacI family transcriptional regulator
MAALSHLRAIGIAVPGAVSVIGFDDVAMAAWPLVGLTTVRQPLVELGARAVDKLSERLADPRRPIATLRLPVTLMSRSTTGPAPAAA